MIPASSILRRHVGCFKLGLKLAQLYIRLSIILLSQQVNDISSGIIRHYVVAFVCLHFCLTGYQNAQFIRRALHYASGSCKFLRQSGKSVGWLWSKETRRLPFQLQLHWSVGEDATPFSGWFHLPLIYTLLCRV